MGLWCVNVILMIGRKATPFMGVVVYADWTKPPALAGGDPYLHTYCYLKDDRLKDGGFKLITDE